MDQLEPGMSFEGRYTVLGELGAGSFGRVYRARQLSTGQDVALKLLHESELETPEQAEKVRERFRRELRACAQLAHPHIVRLLDSGETAGGQLYAVFEYVPGATLRQVLETERRLAFPEALSVMGQVLDALACAHELGLVHRDLKPENIMLVRTGLRRHALVLDFGLAGATAFDQSAARLTVTGEILGTPAYAAPEQLRGEPVTASADLYSWGLILIECLTGETVVRGRTAYEALMKQLAPEAVPLPAWLRDHRLDRIISAVTAKDPAHRDVSAARLLVALEEAQRRVAELAPAAALGEEERRQLTVVTFGTRVMGPAGNHVDLEALDRAERLQLALVARLAREAGGTLARPQAGRVSVVFGYPRAREHDARRAAQLALRVVDEAGQAGPHAGGVRLQARAGLHSGLGTVRMETSAPDGEPACEVAGEPLAASVQLLERADAGDVLATEDTRALLGGRLATEPAGTLDLPDRQTPLAVFRLRRREERATVEALSGRPETPLADRTRELAQLGSALERARAGIPGVVLVQGEAGIGKSRLVRELRRRVADPGWLECRCVAEDQASPLRPLIALLGTLRQPLDHLLVRHGFDVGETAPLFASLLGLAADDRYMGRPLSPERLKEATLKATCTLLIRMATAEPLVLAIEDLHWSDPTTLELLQLLVEEVRAAEVVAGGARVALLLLLTARPEFTSPWGAGEVTLVPLERLAVAEVAPMVVAQWTRAEAPSPALILRIAARTDGVPLFVEEVMQVLQATGTGGDADIPGTLRELLAARLDALSPSAYETAQLAAALGREFPHDLLAAASEHDGKTEWMLRRDLQELVDRRLVYRRSAAGAYVFKHALVRDAAYDSMVPATRRRVHRRIAETIVEQLPGLADERPELLAHHQYEGGDALAAAAGWLRAGDRARRRAAYVEAVEHLERGLAGLVGVPESRERREVELELLIALGTVHFSTKGYGAPEVGETFGRARELCGDEGGEAASLKTLTGLVSMYLIRGDRDATEELLPRCRVLTGEGHEAAARVFGHVALGAYAFWRGNHRPARAELDRARSIYRTEEFRRFAVEYGWDGGVFAHGYAMWNEAILGRPAETEALYRDLLALAESSFDPYSLPLALGFGMAAAQVLLNVEATAARAARLIEVAAEQRMYLWLAVAQCGQGWVLARQGACDDGVALLRQGLDLYRMTGAMTPYAYYLSFLADALRAAGKIDDGLAVVAEGLALCEQTLGELPAPELWRLRGELARSSGDRVAAEAAFRRALEVARARSATVWALRAAVSLADLLAEQGRADEGRAILRTEIGPLRDAETFPDLDAARELIGG
jgi:TOMM system kinase/cyclase fusion protein